MIRIRKIGQLGEAEKPPTPPPPSTDLSDAVRAIAKALQAAIEQNNVALVAAMQTVAESQPPVNVALPPAPREYRITFLRENGVGRITGARIKVE